jgi:hypothetical protein
VSAEEKENPSWTASTMVYIDELEEAKMQTSGSHHQHKDASNSNAKKNQKHNKPTQGTFSSSLFPPSQAQHKSKH